jgi:hypothetical protein
MADHRLTAGLGTLAALWVVAGWFGFAPVVSGWIGPKTPRDLGISFMEDDYRHARDKAGTTFETLEPGLSPRESLKMEGQHDVATYFSGPEIAVLANRAPWKYNFIRDGQVKIAEDGVVEAAGLVRLNRLSGHAAAHGGHGFRANLMLGYFRLIGFDTPYYARFSAKVVEGKLEMEMKDLQIGRWKFSKRWLEAKDAAIEELVRTHLAQHPEISVRKLEFIPQLMRFEGMLPDKIRTSPE